MVSGSKLDWANPWTVGGLDLDQKWIITGIEAFTWQSHSLIEAHVCRRYPTVIGVYKKRTHSCMYGEQTVSKASWMGSPEARLCTSKWQVCYDHNWALCTNRHKFKFIVRPDRSGLIQFRTKVIEVWDRCGSNPDQVQTGLNSEENNSIFRMLLSVVANYHWCMDLSDQPLKVQFIHPWSTAQAMSSIQMFSRPIFFTISMLNVYWYAIVIPSLCIYLRKMTPFLENQ